MHAINPPRILVTKQVDLCQKYCSFAPDQLHHLIYPKLSIKMIEKTKDYCRCTATKRLDKIKMMKDKKVIVSDEDDEDLDDKKKK